jgi:hypothetical protein
MIYKRTGKRQDIFVAESIFCAVIHVANELYVPGFIAARIVDTINSWPECSLSLTHRQVKWDASFGAFPALFFGNGFEIRFQNTEGDAAL